MSYLQQDVNDISPLTIPLREASTAMRPQCRNGNKSVCVHLQRAGNWGWRSL